METLYGSAYRCATFAERWRKPPFLPLPPRFLLSHKALGAATGRRWRRRSNVAAGLLERKNAGFMHSVLIGVPRLTLPHAVPVQASMETDVLIVGSGPAGLSTALNLTTYGIRPTLLTKYPGVAPTPRAHVTNQRTFEVFRDLGIEEETLAQAVPYTEMPNILFTRTLAGQEFGRLRFAGNDPRYFKNYCESSPSIIADLPQSRLEPILLAHALARGAHICFETEYLASVQDDTGVTTTIRDRATGEQRTVRSRYLVGADGARSRIAAELKLPFVGDAAMAYSANILFEADLSRYVEHRPGFLYFVMRAASDPGGAGMGILRAIRPWKQWLLMKNFIATREEAELTEAQAMELVRSHLGDPDLPVRITAVDPWELNSLYATRYSDRRVFCMGDAVHRHAPANGLGSNTAIQDGYNLAWKLALVLQGKAGAGLLDTYDAERVPVGEQVVKRATQSLWDYLPILEAFALTDAPDTPDSEQPGADFPCMSAATPQAAGRRKQLRAALAAKQYDFNSHGVEMNGRYHSGAVLADLPANGSHTSSGEGVDAELFYIPTTAPGARVPHAWLDQNRKPVSTLDLAGKGRFSLLTGAGGEVWHAAAQASAAQLGLEIACFAIGLGCPVEDPYGDWAALREVEESGCLLLRPDAHVAWRAAAAPPTELEATRAIVEALRQILFLH